VRGGVEFLLPGGSNPMETLEVIKNVGFPSAVLIFVGIALWRVLVWTGNKVVLPIKDAHVKLVESAQQTNETNAKTLEKMGQLLESNDSRDKATYALVVESHEMLKEMKK
jgi:hypothetical protein